MNPIEIIKILRICTWIYNDKKPDLGDKLHYGLIAQDLLEQFGEDTPFVSFDGEYYKVNYEEFTGPMLYTIQKLIEQLSDQENRICKLEEIIKEVNNNGKHDL